MNVYVGNIDYNVKKGELKQLFGVFGEVESIKFIEDQDTGKFKGIGFVKFKEASAAEEAIEKLNGFVVNDRKLRVMAAKSPTGETKGRPAQNKGPRSGPRKTFQKGPRKPNQSGNYQTRRNDYNRGNTVDGNRIDNNNDGNSTPNFNRKDYRDGNSSGNYNSRNSGGNKFKSRKPSDDNSYGNQF